MKLALIVSLFDGEELLEGALRQLRTQAQVVILLWQRRSYYGECHIQDPPPAALQALGLVDVAEEYLPRPAATATEAERAKRNYGLQLARQQGCTHFLFMDADEYYDTAQVAGARALIAEKGYEATACRLYTYYKAPQYRLRPMEQYWVPFICELLPHTRAGFFSSFPVYADPTRMVNTCRSFHAFATDALVMHHYSWLRRDIGLKLRNSSARVNYAERIPELVECFEKWEYPQKPCFFDNYDIELTEDIFGIGRLPFLKK